MNFRFVSLFAPIALFSVVVSTAYAQGDAFGTAEVPSKPFVLTPLPDSTTVIDGPSEATEEFGTVDQGSSVHITHTFVLRNDSGTTIKIVRIQPSCGCTTAIAEGTSALPFDVPAGGVVKIDADIDPLRLYPGDVEKSITLFAAGQTQSIAVLNLTGTLKSAISFSPDQLDFGNVVFGDSPTLDLTATVDNSVLPSLTGLQFQTSDSSLTGKQISATPFGSGSTLVKYAVSVSPTAYVGQINATVSLYKSVPGGRTYIVGSPVSVVGNVVGSISASPEMLTFADAVTGNPFSRTVLITGLSEEDIKGSKVFSASPMVLAALTPVSHKKSSAAKVAVLTVSLSKQASGGTLSTQVIVTAPDGEQLLIPVFVVWKQAAH